MSAASQVSGWSLPFRALPKSWPRAAADALLIRALGLALLALACLPAARALAVDRPAPGAREPAADTRTVYQLPLRANDLLYDPTRDRLYASISNADANRPNTLTVLDAASGAIETSIYVGKEPNRLAMSDDGHYLYVGLDGEGTVRRVDLTSQTAGLQLYLGAGCQGALVVAADIVALPGQPTSIAVSRQDTSCSPGFKGIVVYDDAIPRQKRTADRDPINALELGVGSHLYGYDTAIDDFVFYRLNVDQDGVSVVDEKEGLISGFDVAIRYDGGKLFTTSGLVIDPEARQVLGTFSGVGTAASVAPDVAGGTVDFVANGQLLTFSLASFSQTGALTIPGLSGSPGSLVRLAGQSRAFRTSGGQVFLVLPPGTPAPPAPPDPPDPPANQPSVLQAIPLQANDLIYDRLRNKLYASVPSSDWYRGNSVLVLNAETGAQEARIVVGSEPDKLAISDDGQYLYVGLNGAAAVRRVDLQTRQPDLQFSIGDDTLFGRVQAADLAVVAGKPHLLAVLRRDVCCDPSQVGLQLYKDGVLVGAAGGDYRGANRIEAGPSGRIYGDQFQNSFNYLARLTADDLGLTYLDIAAEYGGPDFRADGGLAFLGGWVFDLERPALVGKIDDLPQDEMVIPDVAANRVSYLAGNRLLTFELSGYSLVNQELLGGVNGQTDLAIRLASGRVAFRTTAGRIYLVLPPGTPQPAVIDPPPDRPAATPIVIQTFGLELANDLAYDALRKKLYASIPGRVPERGNTIARIDVASQTIEAFTWVGSEPNKLAISDDFHYLYVGLDGASSVRRLDLTTQTLDPVLYVGNDTSSGPYGIEDLATVPGRADVVAVSRRNFCCSPHNLGDVLFKDGVQQRGTGYGNRIAATSSSELYGYNSEGTGAELYEMSVDDNGIAATRQLGQLPGRLGGLGIVPGGGLIFTTTGQVVDPARPAVLGRVASSGLVAPDVARGVVYVLTGSELLTYSLETYLPTAWSHFGANGGRLISLGDGKLACCAGGGAVYLVLPSGTKTDPPPGPNPPSTTSPTVTQLALRTNDAVYDRLRERVYVPVPASSDRTSDAVVAIDPQGGRIAGTVSSGGDPRKLALSDDAHYLYVSLANGVVRRVDLTGVEKLPLEFNVGSDPRQGAYRVEDLAAVPGSPQSVAVSRMNTCCSPRHVDVVIYDNGQLRGSPQAGTGGNFIQAASATRLYGYDDENSSHAFFRLTVGPGGVSGLDGTNALFKADSFRVEPGGQVTRVYTDSGQVFDPEAGQKVATLPEAAGPSASDTAKNLVYYFTPHGLTAFDLGTYRQVEYTPVQGMSGKLQDLVRTASGFVATTGGGQVFVIRLASGPPSPPPGECKAVAAKLKAKVDKKTPGLVSFTPTITPKGTCQITSSSLDFGDGSQTTVHSGQATTHTYTSPGTKSVVLTVTRTGGSPVQVNLSVTIPPPRTGH